MKGERSDTFNDEQIDDIARLYRSGASIATIANRYGVSTAPIRNALIIRGVRMRPAARRRMGGLPGRSIT